MSHIFHKKRSKPKIILTEIHFYLYLMAEKVRNTKSDSKIRLSLVFEITAIFSVV